MAMEELQQQRQWKAAQSIVVSVDLICSVKAQLRLLSSVDRHPCLSSPGPALTRAIHRYENCWLPLLAEHGPCTGTGLPLIPPLDCAWIWHCHKLNPVQYIKDCESYYGKLLDAPLTPSVDNDEAAKFTKQLWDCQYPQEEYDRIVENAPSRSVDSISGQIPKFGDEGSRKLNYNLEEAVARQRSFNYQVSRTHMGDESFLNVALQRYKGYLYLFKLSNLKVFLVPTYDIDLMWHSHQSSPGAYRKDMLELLGKTLNHDDTVSDRTEGKKLDVGFNQTREYWQQNFGTLYERAGAMYRGEPPNPLPPFLPTEDINAARMGTEALLEQPYMELGARKTMQVFVAVIGAKNVPSKYKGSLAVQLLFQKKCAGLRIKTPWVKASSNPEWGLIRCFQCESSTEGLRLELRSKHLKCLNFLSGSKVVGDVVILWQTLLSSPSLSWDGWVPLCMRSKSSLDCKSAFLRISVSITPPVSAPYLLRMGKSLLTDNGKHIFSCTPGCWLSRTVFDHANREAFIIRICGIHGANIFSPSMIQVHQGSWEDSSRVTSEKGVISARILGSAKQLVESSDSKFTTMRKWSMFENAAHLVVTKNIGDPKWDLHPDVHFTGNIGYPVRLLCGRKLQYEQAGATMEDEAGFITVIRYSPDACLGKATAIFNWKSGAIEVSPEESVMFVLLLSATISASVLDMQGVKRAGKEKYSAKISRRFTCTDEWGSVIFDGCSSSSSNSRLQYYPWYSMSAA